MAIVGVEHTGPAANEVEARLWILSADGAPVAEHAVGDPNLPGPAWDVRVLDDHSVLVLLDEPVAQGAASRAVARLYQVVADWATAPASPWSFQQTDNEAPAQSIEARALYEVDADQGVFGLVGSFLLSGQSIKHLIANFSLTTLPEDVPPQITHSETGDAGPITVQASDAIYWPEAPGGAAFITLGSAIYDGDQWSQTNVLNSTSKLIGAFQSPDEHNRTAVRLGDQLLVLAQHESQGSRVRLLSLADVTAAVVGFGADAGIDPLAMLELGSITQGEALACHGGEVCLVAGASGGSPAWDVFRVTPADDLEACGP